MKVLRDTTINGRTYYEFNKFILGVLNETIWPAIVADSAGYVIGLSGSIVVINDGTRDTISSHDYGYLNAIIKTGLLDTAVSATAGSFTCLETVTDVYYVNGNSPTGTNPRYMYEYWSKHVGLVKRSYFYANAPYEDIVTLKSYHLEP